MDMVMVMNNADRTEPAPALLCSSLKYSTAGELSFFEKKKKLVRNLHRAQPWLEARRYWKTHGSISPGAGHG